MRKIQDERISLDQIRFSRGLSLWQVMARGLGVMVIMAAFVLLGDAVATAGPLTPVALLLAALLLLVNLLGYVELAASGPHPDGAYAQVHEARGGWLLILSGLGVCALLAQGFAVQITTLLQDHLGLVLPVWPWAVGLVILLAANNALGTQEGPRGSITLLLLLMAVLLGFTLLAMPHINLDHYAGIRRNWGPSLTLWVVSFVGLEITASLQNEMRRRTSHAPRAMLLMPVIVALLEAAITTVVVGVAGSVALAHSQIPLALLGASVAGGAGRPFILIVGGLVLALGLNDALVLVVRQIYVMSRDGYWPTAIRRMHPRFGTPTWAIVLAVLLLLPLTSLPVTRSRGQ
ncbi:MAG: APC family permease [Anaerolineae bacterium]